MRWRGQWVRVDPDEALALADLEQHPGRLGTLEALAAGLAGSLAVEGLGDVEVVTAGALEDLLERLRTHSGGAPVLDRIPRRCATTINDYIKLNNENPGAFKWTKSAQQIIDKVNRCKACLRHYTSPDSS